MLEVREISVSYGDIQVLTGVTLRVEEGEIVTLIGSNGAGKTTTINTVSGLMETKEGTITFDSQRIEKLPPHRIIELGATQIPEGRELFPEMTVLENLELGAYLPRARTLAQESLDWVYQLFPALKGRGSQMAGTLSGGEQQMVAIGRGLMTKPSLLMMDEPSLGLAPLVVAELFRIISEINQHGLSILLVEQNARHALNLASRAYVMETGRITREGSGDELLDDPLIRAAYLGM